MHRQRGGVGVFGNGGILVSGLGHFGYFWRNLAHRIWEGGTCPHHLPLSCFLLLLLFSCSFPWRHLMGRGRGGGGGGGTCLPYRYALTTNNYCLIREMCLFWLNKKKIKSLGSPGAFSILAMYMGLKQNKILWSNLGSLSYHSVILPPHPQYFEDWYCYIYYCLQLYI